VYAVAIDELFGVHLTKSEAESVGRALRKVVAAARGENVAAE